jgi:hypothetical protein
MILVTIDYRFIKRKTQIIFRSYIDISSRYKEKSNIYFITAKSFSGNDNPKL